LTGVAGSVISTGVAKALEKELKRPDEFVSFWTRFGAKVSQNRRKVIASAITAAVAVAIVWGWTAYRHSSAAKATAAFQRVERVASADLLLDKAEDRASDKATDKAPAKTEGDDVPRFKTEKERLEAANKEADAFIAEFGPGGLGRKALADKASRLIMLGNASEAASIYQRLAASETDPGLRMVELEGIAVAREVEGKLDDALRAYSDLADQAGRGSKFYLDRALFAKARILEKQGKAKDAEKVLREILDKVPKTPLRSQIDDRLALLAEK
jgi:hypothetical protein